VQNNNLLNPTNLYLNLFAKYGMWFILIYMLPCMINERFNQWDQVEQRNKDQLFIATLGRIFC
jgi:hypothetical protein